MALPIIAHPPALVLHEVLSDRGLRILVEERTGFGAPLPVPGVPGAEGREIIQGPADVIFEISWEVVACFAVRGDPFPTGRPSTSTLVDVGASSSFLDWVRRESYADPVYIAAISGQSNGGGELRHWKVSTSEALFDVAAIVPPKVRIVSPVGS